LIALYLSLGRSIGALTGIAAGFILVTAEAVIAVWTAGKAPFDPLVIIAFLAGVLISGPAQNSIMLLQMSNVPRPLATASLIQIGLVGVLMAALVPSFGPVGAAIALGFSECMAVIWSSYAATLLLRLPQWRYASTAFGSELAGFALGCSVPLAIEQFHRPSNIVALVAFYMLAGMVVSIPAIFLALGGKQRRRLWSKINVAFART
jgi:O-antigen/teichoic acid export membrane protein